MASMTDRWERSPVKVSSRLMAEGWKNFGRAFLPSIITTTTNSTSRITSSDDLGAGKEEDAQQETWSLPLLFPPSSPLPSHFSLSLLLSPCSPLSLLPLISAQSTLQSIRQPRAKEGLEEGRQRG